MKHSMMKFLVLLSLLSFSMSCSKEGNGDGGGGKGPSKNLPGILYYDWATDGMLKINLATGKGATVLPYDVDRNFWDISQDGKRILICSDAKDGDYDANVYTYENLADGTIIRQFKYYPTDGDITIPHLSFDEKLIAVQPTYDDGIVIMDITGKVLHNLSSFMGKKIEEHICWMPDNTVLFRVENDLYRTNAAFTQAKLIRSMDFADWGGFSCSVDGSKIAFNASNHIWMMDADGANLVQVTDSDLEEVYPIFSPDGKYLQIGCNYHLTGPFGHLWYLAIIPADGKKYNVNEGADSKVMAVWLKGESSAVAADGATAWR